MVGQIGTRAGEIAAGSRDRTVLGLGARLVVAMALVACGSHGSVGYDGEPVPPEPPGTTGTVSTGDGGSSEAPWGAGDTDPDCGCDGEDDGTDGSGSDGTDGGGFDGGGFDGSGDASGDAGGDGGDGGSGLRLPPTQGRGASPQALVVQLDGTNVTDPGCVHGILADRNGRRIAGAIVSAAATGGAGGQGTAVTTRRGHFCIHAALARAQRCVEVGTVVPSGP